MRLLIVQMFEVTDFFLFLINGASKVLALVMLLIECAFQVIVLRLLDRKQLVMILCHHISLPCNIVQVPLFESQPLLLLLNSIFQMHYPPI